MTVFWRFRQRQRRDSAILMALLVAGGAATQANDRPLQPKDTILDTATAAATDRAAQHGYDNVSVNIRPLDKRLRLPLCSEALISDISPASQVLGPVNVGISCNGGHPWTIYVRTQVVAQRSIPVLVRALPRHTIITAEDLKQVNQPLQSNVRGLIDDPEQIIGMELTRPLDAGSIVRVSQLRKPNIIKRGQQVTLVSGTGGLEVRIAGKALGNAALGERVAVSNLSSGKHVEGIARADGTVSVQ